LVVSTCAIIAVGNIQNRAIITSKNNIYNKNNIDEKEEDEALKKSYEYVFSLTQRLENNLCSENDYTDIPFHIEQINYNEIIIVL